MFDCPDYIKPEYVAYRTYQDRYSDLEDEEEEDDPLFTEPWGVYDPD